MLTASLAEFATPARRGSLCDSSTSSVAAAANGVLSVVTARVATASASHVAPDSAGTFPLPTAPSVGIATALSLSPQLMPTESVAEGATGLGDAVYALDVDDDSGSVASAFCNAPNTERSGILCAMLDLHASVHGRLMEIASYAARTGNRDLERTTWCAILRHWHLLQHIVCPHHGLLYLHLGNNELAPRDAAVARHLLRTLLSAFTDGTADLLWAPPPADASAATMPWPSSVPLLAESLHLAGCSCAVIEESAASALPGHINAHWWLALHGLPDAAQAAACVAHLDTLCELAMCRIRPVQPDGHGCVFPSAARGVVEAAIATAFRRLDVAGTLLGHVRARSVQLFSTARQTTLTEDDRPPVSARDEVFVAAIRLLMCLVLGPNHDLDTDAPRTAEVVVTLRDLLARPEAEETAHELLAQVSRRCAAPVGGWRAGGEAVLRLARLLCPCAFERRQYRLEQTLAHGAYGTVHLCALSGDRATGTDPWLVAKLMGVNGPDNATCWLGAVLVEVLAFERLCGSGTLWRAAAVEAADSAVDACAMPLVDYGVYGESYWLIMRRAWGNLSAFRQQLEARCETRVQLIAACAHLYDEAVRCVRGCAVAGVHHFDVKSDNLLVVRDSGARAPLLRLCDFGCAHLFAIPRRPEQEELCTREARGTEFCMSPEMVRGQGAGVASDVWSTACLLYELLTGGDYLLREPDWSRFYLRLIGSASESSADPSIPELMPTPLLSAYNHQRLLSALDSNVPATLAVERFLERVLVRNVQARPSIDGLAALWAEARAVLVGDAPATDWASCAATLTAPLPVISAAQGSGGDSGAVAAIAPAIHPVAAATEQEAGDRLLEMYPWPVAPYVWLCSADPTAVLADERGQWWRWVMELSAATATVDADAPATDSQRRGLVRLVDDGHTVLLRGPYACSTAVCYTMHSTHGAVGTLAQMHEALARVQRLSPLFACRSVDEVAAQCSGGPH